MELDNTNEISHVDSDRIDQGDIIHLAGKPNSAADRRGV